MKTISRALAVSILAILCVSPAAVLARKNSPQSSRADIPKPKKHNNKKQKFKRRTLNKRHSRRKNPPKQ